MFWVLSGLGPGPTPGGAPENFWICILEVSFKQPACSQPTSQHLDLFLECEGWHLFQANICRIVRVDFFIDTFIPGIWGLAFFQVNICKIVRVYFFTDAFIPGIWGLVVFQANICRMVHVDFFINAFVSGMWWLTFLSDKHLQDCMGLLLYRCIYSWNMRVDIFLSGEHLQDGARWLLYKHICFWNVMIDIFVRQTFAGSCVLIGIFETFWNYIRCTQPASQPAPRVWEFSFSSAKQALT